MTLRGMQGSRHQAQHKADKSRPLSYLRTNHAMQHAHTREEIMSCFISGNTCVEKQGCRHTVGIHVPCSRSGASAINESSGVLLCGAQSYYTQSQDVIMASTHSP